MAQRDEPVTTVWYDDRAKVWQRWAVTRLVPDSAAGVARFNTEAEARSYAGRAGSTDPDLLHLRPQGKQTEGAAMEAAMEGKATETVFGLEVPRTHWFPARDFISDTHGTPNRENVVVRIGRELAHTRGYKQTGYVVMTSDEARKLAARLLYLAERPNDDLVIGSVLREAARVFDSGDCETVAAALVHAFEALDVGPRAQRMVEERVERHGSLDEAIDAL